MNTGTPPSRSTSFVVAICCDHGAVPRRVELPLEEYQHGPRRVVRAYLPGVDPGQDILVTRQGAELRVRCQRIVESLECESADPHRATFVKILSIPARTATGDVTAEYADGALFVSWPTDSSAAPTGNGDSRAQVSQGAVTVTIHEVGTSAA